MKKRHLLRLRGSKNKKAQTPEKEATVQSETATPDEKPEKKLTFGAAMDIIANKRKK